ncbi:hypothetical protein IX51_06125 [uncultured archaeon]|nr:hypothetical protein IX51_06125 [uncultured archaeon]HKJ96739.1 NUDIX domain-containing protein [Thermoplasmataceae archaeon]
MHEEFSSGMIVYKGDGNNPMFLFLTRKEGFLDFPKGHIEEGETEVQSAIRETREETGLKITPDTEFRYNQVYWYQRGGERIRKSVIMFLGEAAENSRVQVSFEHEGHKWLTFEQAMDQLSYKNQKEMLTSAMNYIMVHKAK